MSGTIMMTNQRELVLEYVNNSCLHPAANEIYNNVKRRLPRISKKTVYNNLKALSEAGLIQEIITGGVKRYEPVMKSHHHLICQVCDRIFDMEEEKLTKLAAQVGDELKDFEVSFTTTNFHGVCKYCKERIRYG